MQTLDQYHEQRRSIFLPKSDWPISDEQLRLSRAGKAPLNISDSDVSRITSQVLQRDTHGVEKLSTNGTTHLLWAVELDTERVIFRANSLPAEMVDFPMVVEAALIRHFANQGYPVADIRCVDLTRTRCETDFAIGDESGGMPLANLDDDERLLLPQLAELGRWMGRIHAERISRGYGWIAIDPADPIGNKRGNRPLFQGLFASWPEFLDVKFAEHLRHCVRLKAIDMAEANRIEAWSARIKNTLSNSPSAILQNDLSSVNVFTDGRRIRSILDWEDAILGDPIFDVAGWATFHPVRRHSYFLRGYFSEHPKPADFDLRFWFYFTRISLARTVLRDRFGLIDKPGRTPAAQRIRQGLQELERLTYKRWAA